MKGGRKMRKKVQILRAVLLAIAIFFVASTAFSQGLTQNNFRRIAKGGFGDSANSYSWGEAWFNKELYVGTVRHHLWSLMQVLGQDIGGLGDLGDLDLGDLQPDGPGDFPGGSLYTEEMKGRIYRYRCDKWEEVYQSPTFYFPGKTVQIPGADPIIIPAGDYPKAYGYRTLGKFKGYLYACGVGTWVPPLPFSSIVRSPNGDPGTWEDVTGTLGPLSYNTNNVRGLVEWKGKLYVAASIGGGSASVARRSFTALLIRVQ